jgi:DNA-binding transcriptional LysR family regulator
VATERLFAQIIFPVASPQVARRIASHDDLARVPVIIEPRAGISWQDWLQAKGHAGQRLGPGPEYSDPSLCLDAAISGLGVYLAFETLAVDALDRGSLVTPFAGRHATRNSYWLVSAADRRTSPAARAFAAWLRDEVAAAGLGRAS